jgi:hypothetical protein
MATRPRTDTLDYVIFLLRKCEGYDCVQTLKRQILEQDFFKKVKLILPDLAKENLPGVLRLYLSLYMHDDAVNVLLDAAKPKLSDAFAGYEGVAGSDGYEAKNHRIKQLADEALATMLQRCAYVPASRLLTGLGRYEEAREVQRRAVDDYLFHRGDPTELVKVLLASGNTAELKRLRDIFEQEGNRTIIKRIDELAAAYVTVKQ